MATTKLDLYKLHKDEYATPKSPVLMKTKRAKYLCIEGKGEPGSQTFNDCVGALYSVAYTVKMNQKSTGTDYKVCALEGLWWDEQANGNIAPQPSKLWNWKLLIRTPDFITARDVKAAISQSLAKGKPAAVAHVHLETLNEGTCVQVLHVGPYADEVKTIARMVEFAGQQNYVPHGLHHEIYLSDPSRVPPERLRTILRLPIQTVKRPAAA